MVETHCSSDLPLAILQLPQSYEFCFTALLGVRIADMAEAVDADLHGAVILDRIHLERARDKFAVNLSADVGFDGGHERGAAVRSAGLVVIELEILGDHGAKLLEVAGVVGIEQSCVEAGDGLV